MGAKTGTQLNQTEFVPDQSDAAGCPSVHPTTVAGGDVAEDVNPPNVKKPTGDMGISR
ncbi:hypothetical protein Bca4012_006839 [Brassica carinata]|uniref:(rape) hypothetical protein n=1 Tax=Brassica napus TaxID=3708 RepID=A0A078JDU5_BRANA|nr:unnamed protein product [Brassica napus]CDY63205.1 BnaC03g75980D [Brassica napus]